MAEPFLSEIRVMSFVFAPKGWALCNGQLMPINQNQALFSLLGTTFGGDGRVNFALPDLRGRTPIHVGSGHTHVLQATSIDGTSALPTPAGTMALANSKNYDAYRAATSLTPLMAGTVSNVGGSQAHLNMQPFLTLSFCIALQGIFPSAT